MKKNVKALVLGALSLSLLFTMTACGSTDTAAEEETVADYKIAVVQQLDHASMDQIVNATVAELEAQADELGITIEIATFSGQNDASVLTQIGAQLIADEYDAILPIGTLAAQQLAVEAEDTETPVIYGAVSDPETAGLTDISYVTGTSDALNTPFMLDMMLAQNPDIQTVGLLYSLSEPNSTVPIAEAKAYLDSIGIAYIEKTGNTNDEIIAAVNSMLDQVDAVFTPTDNVVMATELVISELLADAGIPHYAGADSFVRNGAFATAGVDYDDLGAMTAIMAIEVLETGIVPEFHVMDGGIITVNTETADTLGADYSIFYDLAGTVVEVITTEE